MSQSIENKVKNRIYGKGRGWVFTPKDFADLGSESAINTSLHRFEEKGFVGRAIHGVYFYPEQHELLGIIPPKLEEIARAIARKSSIEIQPSGAYAANLLGLSEQVPGKMVFLTDGESRKIKIGKSEIIFKKTTPQNMKTAGKISGLVIQAIKYIGKDSINDSLIKKIKETLSENDMKRLKLDSILAPVWIRKIINERIL